MHGVQITKLSHAPRVCHSRRGNRPPYRHRQLAPFQWPLLYLSALRPGHKVVLLTMLVAGEMFASTPYLEGTIQSLCHHLYFYERRARLADGCLTCLRVVKGEFGPCNHRSQDCHAADMILHLRFEDTSHPSRRFVSCSFTAPVA